MAVAAVVPWSTPRMCSILRLPSQNPSQGTGPRITSPGRLSFRFRAGFREIPPRNGCIKRNPNEAFCSSRTRIKRLIPVVCSAGSSDSSSSSSWWKQAQQKVISPEKILRTISSATSSPICQFIESPATVLHSLNPRIKLVWLLALVMLPARSTVFMRYGIVVYLALLSIWVLPERVWMDQLGRVAFLSGIIFISLALGADSAPSICQSRTPPQSLTGLPHVPPSLDGYSYLMMKIGPLQLTRKGFLVASTSACLSFTIFQSASLCLATTTPEQLASALRWFLSPFAALGAPVAEIMLTLLLSLRFINIVFDEVRNVALGIVARRINWEKLTLLETLDVFFMYIQRIFRNIFNHAEQISQAMIVRGFRGDCSSHKIYLHPNPSLGMVDVLSLLCLGVLVLITVMSESFLL